MVIRFCIITKNIAGNISKVKSFSVLISSNAKYMSLQTKKDNADNLEILMTTFAPYSRIKIPTFLNVVQTQQCD
jgi:hypothetical protein